MADLEFDIERLASEIDEVFQQKIDKHTTNIINVAERANQSIDKFATAAVDNSKVLIKDAIIRSIGENRELLLQEFEKGRATINIGAIENPLSLTIDHLDHPATEEIVKSLALYHKAMLVGPAGTGKTTIVSFLAERMKTPFYKYSCSRDSSVHDLLGYKQPKSETYLETNFLKAYENGGIFLVDEYDAMSGDMALFFNGVADNSKFISVPHRDDKPTAVKHKDFYLIMCGNTWGKGSYEYSGRDIQDKALLDRFRLCRHFVGYHELLEKKLLGHNYQFYINVRKLLDDAGSYLSTRNIEEIALSLQNNIKTKDIIESLVHDLTEGDKKNILQKLSL